MVTGDTENAAQARRMLILWALLARDGGGAFQSAVRPAVERADREALETAGLIRSERRGRYRKIWIEATDKGWDWAGQHLRAPLPEASRQATPVLQALLGRIADFMSARGFVLADLMGQQAAPSEAAEAPPAASAPADLRDRIRAAYLAATGGHLNRRALLRKVRENLGDADRAAVDAELIRLQREQAAILYPLDDRAQLAPADRDAALLVNGEPRHILWMDR